MRVNGTLYYVLKDKLGSANVITDASGNTVGEARYYPYGETRLTTGTMVTDQLFTGQREQAGLGIYYYGSRFYSPTLGRFLSADTIVPNMMNPQDFNRYSYVRNNPVKYTDPTGHACVEGTSYCVDPMTRKKSGSLTRYNDYGAPPPPPPPCTRNCGGGVEDGGNPYIPRTTVTPSATTTPTTTLGTMTTTTNTSVT